MIDGIALYLPMLIPVFVRIETSISLVCLCVCDAISLKVITREEDENNFHNRSSHN